MGKISVKDKWIVGNEEDGCNLWGIGYFPPAFSRDFPHYAKLPPMWNFIEFCRDHIRLIVPSRLWSRNGNAIVQRVVRRPGYFAEQKRQVIKAARALYEFSRQAKEIDFFTLSDHDLGTLFFNHDQLVYRMLGYGLISTLTEVPHALFTRHVENFISHRVEILGLKSSPVEYMHTLSSVTLFSEQRKESLSLLRLLAAAQKDQNFLSILKNKKIVSEKTLRNFPGFARLVESHVKNFSWVYYGYNGPAFGNDRVISELRRLLRQGIDPKQILHKADIEQKNVARNIKIRERVLKFTPKEKQLLAAFRDTIDMKLVRKDALTYSFFAMERAVRELARRAGITFKQAQFIVPGEHRLVLSGEMSKMKETLARRIKYCVYVYVDDKPKILTGNRARAFVKKYYKEEKLGDVSELAGQVACVGKTRGRVKIVNVPSDMKKMKIGDILVSIATTPEIVPAMKVAGAIVAERGGVTSHAAIVSRELKVPCVIGTKIATKVFKDGDIVEVDAYKGIVRKI